MKRLKVRLAAAMTAGALASGGMTAPSLLVQPIAAAAAVGATGLLLAQPAHAEPGWRICGAIGTRNGATVSIITKYRTSNPRSCNDAQISLARSWVGGVNWSRSYHMETCETVSRDIGRGGDVCNGMSSGQSLWDWYVTTSANGQFDKKGSR